MREASAMEVLIIVGGTICAFLLMIGNAILWHDWLKWRMSAGWRFFWYMVTSCATIGCMITAAAVWLK